MLQWDVVEVMIALAGLFAAVGVPVIRLNTSIVTLTAKLEALTKKNTEDMRTNEQAHHGISKELREQGRTIGDHERRIVVLEHEKGE